MLKTLAEQDGRFPAEGSFGKCDVRPALLGIVRGERVENHLRARL